MGALMKTPDDNSRLKILVVEDSRTQAEYLLHILEKEGYRAILAVNGNEALEIIRTDRPTMVLTDIVMPEMDGYVLCSAIKKNQDTADIPVILVTQLFDPPDLMKGLEAGANDIIIKPFKPEHVISRITSTLRSLEHQDSDGANHTLEVSFDGETHRIPEDQLRTPAIILSSYNAAMRKNAELQETNERLAVTNEDLLQKVENLEQEKEKFLSSRMPENSGGSIEPATTPPYQNPTPEDRFRMITELSPFPISIIDSSGNYQYVNKKFQQVFGYTISDIPRGKDWPSREFTVKPERTNTISNGRPDRMNAEWGVLMSRIIPVTCKDGTVRQIRFCPVILAGGEQFVVYEDLTDKTESDRLRSVLASIVNSSNDAIIGKNLDGTILSWNRAAERYYGYLAEEVIGKSIEIIIPPELRVHIPLFLERVANGEIIDRFDTIRLRKDGSRIGVCVTLSPIKDDEGRIFGISTIAQNIADREKTEAGRMFRQQVLHSR